MWEQEWSDGCTYVGCLPWWNVDTGLMEFMAFQSCKTQFLVEHGGDVCEFNISEGNLRVIP